ncbi:30S ribosomal protein S1 [candidate division Kazan bacterium]|uniref:30S ribosomal protein S1 n=1 Tax=candidate division Kazan bacterium TaxID=2202143 RepID=A0A420ZD50_UNCK3|nr:MAG: 30S ribosomal protein S1 [candidate division Kazan bacterium]
MIAMATKTKSKHPFAEILESKGGDLRIYKESDLVTGTVTAITNNRIWLDIDDGRFIGIISNRELAEEGIVAPDFKVGDQITASVLIPESEEGFMVLSIRDALQNQGWEALEARKAKDEIFDVKVVEANRGGLIVEADGLRGFLPVSQLAPEHYPRVGSDRDEILARLAEFEGKTMTVKILDLDKNINKLIFSERTARREEFDKLVSGIKVGDVIEGKVSGIVDFGIFVSLGQLEGLVHISEISWDKVNHPGDFAKVGATVKVQVIGIDDDKISLSMKRLESDPWLEVIKDFKVGQEVEGLVTQIMPFGVFVKVNEKVDGLIHISELAHEHITDPGTVVKEGDRLKVKVIDLGPDSHRLGLSLKALTKPTMVVSGAPVVKVPPVGVKNSLDQLGLSAGVVKKLREAGINSVEDLSKKTEAELESIPGIGKVSAAKIIASMKK